MEQREKKKSMTWVIYALAAALAWGFYGAMLHRGQMALANPMKALLCVGMAYFLIGVLAPAGMLASEGALKNFSSQGTTWATISGALAISSGHAPGKRLPDSGLIADIYRVRKVPNSDIGDRVE